MRNLDVLKYNSLQKLGDVEREKWIREIAHIHRDRRVQIASIVIDSTLLRSN